jgi:hypothetical protein
LGQALPPFFLAAYRCRFDLVCFDPASFALDLSSANGLDFSSSLVLDFF